VTYRLQILPSAEREMSRLDPEVRRRIDRRILALAEDPRPPGVKALAGPAGGLRVRVGDWRIVYRVEDERLIVLIVRVGNRREVYRSR
jgi:mRNA interferase RelE/StbE